MTCLASAIRPGLMAAAGLLLALIAQAAEAQNRTNAYLRETIFTSRGLSNAHINRHVAFSSASDTELLPGIYYSRGGFTSTDGSWGQSLDTLRLFNESSVTFCVRPEGRLTSGPFMNTQSAGNVGVNFLVTPGASETVLAHSMQRVVSGSAGELEMAFYFWLADMSAPAGRRCAALAPPALERWARDPQGMNLVVDPLLREALGLEPPYRPGVSRAAARLTETLRSRGVTIDAQGRLVRIRDLHVFHHGAVESSLAYAEERAGRGHALIWLHNGHDRAFCGLRGEPLSGSFSSGSYALPARGFYIPARSGRLVVHASIVGDQPMDLDPEPRYVLWYPLSSEASDEACAAVAPDEFYAQFQREAPPGIIFYIGEATALSGD